MTKSDATQPGDPQDETTFATTADDTTADDTTADDTTDETTADDTTQLEQTVHSDTTEQFDRTEQLDTTEGNQVQRADTPATAARADEHGIAPLPERPSGPHAPAIVLGLVCLAVAGIILAQELGDLTVDWGDVGPVGIVLTGAVLVLFGLVGLVTSRRNSKTS
ncbi:hypothetical protein [Phycicoccus sp. Soil803]|uniref:hypothetical protein n=1 Tax=Phycicoccus sp. Soil803 TaxID=1736415 RepID=UPI00070931C1|nr:hypothetical protein [Phycicoccus sp. Soil803]KRF23994.1 hypothetical protein ASG95_04990 [Phycicoccus sp. Soil803]